MKEIHRDLFMADGKQSFWTSLPGILTGVAALITALTGLVTVIITNLPNNEQKPPAAQEQQQSEPEVKEYLMQSRVNTPPSPAPMLRPLVDCSNEAYKIPNTVRSLMSWSNYFHEQIVEQSKKNDPSMAGRGGLRYLCEKTLGYRGSAHCHDPDEPTVRVGLSETLNLCKDVGPATEEDRY